MYKVEIPADRLQEAAIQRRRRLDEERKKIIFNPRVRIMGVDLKSLDEQITTKKEIQSLEKARDSAFDRTIKRTNQILELMDEQAAYDRQTERLELDGFRKAYQKTSERRDFDLYDPNALKKDFPARMNDKDARCGVSGMQRFEGEDLAHKERIRLQKEQMKTWTLEQTYERERKSQEELDEQKRYDEFQKSVGNKMLALEIAVKDARSEQAKYDRDFNHFLAQEKRQREIQAKQRETEENHKEILNNVNGVFLTETPDVFNIGGGHKVRVDLFKGMTQGQKDQIREEQARQRRQVELQREKERTREQDWSIQEAANNRVLTLLDRQKERMKRELATHIRRENELQAYEDKERQHFIDKVLYTNPPTKDYFSQFNTTSR